MQWSYHNGNQANNQANQEGREQARNRQNASRPSACGSALADRKSGAEKVRTHVKAILAELERDFGDMRAEIVPALYQRAELCGVRGYKPVRAIIRGVWRDAGVVESGEREARVDVSRVKPNLRAVIVALAGSSSTSRTPQAAQTVFALLSKFAGFEQPVEYRAVSALLSRCQRAQSDGNTIDDLHSSIDAEHEAATSRLPALWDLARAIDAANAA